MDSRELSEKILREAGLWNEEAAAAKRKIDARLDGLGLRPAFGLPTAVRPGAVASPRSFGLPQTQPTHTTIQDRLKQRLEDVQHEIIKPGDPRSPRGAVTALLQHGGAEPPHVVLSDDANSALGDATWEPSDLSAAVAVTGLQTTALGGTEAKFNMPGIIYVGSGAIGVYWARALGANINSKWCPLMAGMRLAYHPHSAIFFGTNTVGGVKLGGVLTLAFYKLPKHLETKKNGWKLWHKQIGEWTEGSGSDTATGVIAQAFASGAVNGTDVTLGTFSDAGAGTQIFKVGTNFPVGGAVAAGGVIMNASNANTDVIWVAETTALAVASNGPIGALGQDVSNRAIGTKLFMLANSGTQVLGARYRS